MPKGTRRTDIIGILDATGAGFAYGAISVGTSATAIPTANMGNRKAIIVRNNSNSVKVFVGDSNVTTGTGFPLLPSESMPFDLSSGANIYGIVSAGTAEVRYLEVDNS